MEEDKNGDINMLSQINYSNTNNTIKNPNHKNKFQYILDKNSEENDDKKIFFPNFNSGNDKKMISADFFLTLLLKSLSNQERYLLLNKLLTMDWENPDDNLNNYLRELIEKNNSDEELKKTLDYEYFLWDFNNWKNFFLSKQK